jgi:hypothetical protein
VFPSPHIVVGFSVPLLCVLCFTLGRLTRPSRRGLYLRRGGFIPVSRRASVSVSPVMVPRPGTSTGCKPVGRQRAAAEEQAQLAAQSRTTAPSGSGNVTVIRRGGRTTAVGGPKSGITLDEFERAIFGDNRVYPR